MHHYTRYIIYNLATPLMVIILTLTGIVWLTQALRLIDLIVNRGLSISAFLYLSLLLIPSLLGIILPISLFCSVLYIYNKLMMESELIVLKSAGLSKLQLAKPALMIAALLTLVGYSISFYFLPASFREFKDMQIFIRDHYASMLLQEGIFNSPIEGLTVYIDKRDDSSGLLQGILVHDNRQPDNPITMMAKEGKIVRTENGPHFDLMFGNRQEMDRESQRLTVLDFDRYTLDLSLYAQETTKRVRKPKERFLHELFYPKDVEEHRKGKFIAEGHRRIAWPLNNIMLTLIALAFLLSGQLNRRGQWKRMWIATLTALILVIANLGTFNVITKTTWLSPLLYFNILLPSLLAGFGLYSSRFLFSKKETD